MADGNKIGDSGTERILAAFSYLGILFLIPLLFARSSKFAQFHARQGAVLFVVDVVVSVLGWIPVFGWALGLGAMLASIFGLVQALMGNEWELPYLGKYAKDLKI